MKRITLLLGLSVIACEVDRGPESAELGFARLHGRAVGLEPLANERVQVVRFDGETAATIIAESQTDALGNFELELPVTASMVRVDVGVSIDVPSLSALVVGLEPGETRSIEVNAFTRFAATLAVVEVNRDGLSAESALKESARLIDEHFGRIEHARVQPTSPFASDLATEADRSGLLMAGLLEQARGMGVGLPALIDGYNRDLGADGLFDGIGPSGAMTMGSASMDGDSLRGQYAAALRRVLQAASIDLAGQSNLHEDIRRNQSAIFPRSVVITPDPPDAGPQDSGEVTAEDFTGPTLALALLDANEDPLPPGTPVRGLVSIRAEASDPSGIRATQLEIVTADGRFETVRGLELDTTALPDGEFRLGFEAVDTHGNLSRVEVEHLADNRAPQINLVHAAVVGTSPAMIRVSSADEDQVERVTVFANGVLAATLLAPAAEAPTSVAVICPGTSVLEAVAYDRAGNLAVSETAIVCEDRGPEITLLPADWRQEGNVVATYRIDGRTIDYTTNQPVFASFDDANNDELIIERYWPRLHESIVGRNDLPRLRFEVSDRAGAGVVVEARHETAAGAGAWFQPESVGDAIFEVPLSYEQLGLALLEEHASAQAIVVRALDAFGVTTERIVRFRLALRSPPLWIGSCSLIASALNPSTVVNQIRSQAPSEVGSFAVRYSADIPEDSPVVAPEVQVSATPASAWLELSGVSTVRFDGAFTNRSATGGPSYMSCGWVPVGVGSPYERYRCQGVGFDGSWTWLQTPASGAFRTTTLPAAETIETLPMPLNQPSPSPTELHFFEGATPVAPSSGASFQLPADRELEAFVSMRANPIRIQNQVWSWPSQPSLIGPGLAPAVALGTSYWLPPTAGEIGAHGRNLACTPDQRLGAGLGAPNVNPACTWQERAVQTLPRLRRLVVRAERPVLSASLPALGLVVPVQVAPGCAAEWRYDLDLSLL